MCINENCFNIKLILKNGMNVKAKYNHDKIKLSLYVEHHYLPIRLFDVMKFVNLHDEVQYA